MLFPASAAQDEVEAAFYAARRLPETAAGEDIEALSDREREVLAWTAAGRRQVEIARPSVCPIMTANALVQTRITGTLYIAAYAVTTAETIRILFVLHGTRWPDELSHG